MTSLANNIHVIPENSFDRSYLTRLSRNTPAFAVATPKHIYRFWFDQNLQMEPFSKVIDCHLANTSISLQLIVSPGLWNGIFAEIIGDAHLEGIPASLAQAVVLAGAQRLLAKLSTFLHHQVVVTKIHQELPEPSQTQRLGFKVTAGILEGHLAICFDNDLNDKVEAILGMIWSQIHPLFIHSQLFVSLEQAYAQLSEDDYRNLKDGDVIFVTPVCENYQESFVLRLNDGSEYTGALSYDQESMVSRASIHNKAQCRPTGNDGDDGCEDPRRMRLSFEKTTQKLYIKDPAELVPGFEFEWQGAHDPGVVGIRYEGVLFATGKFVKVGARLAVEICRIG